MDDLIGALLDSLELVIAFILLAVGYFRGRHLERRHLADLARREAELSDILTFATRYPAITPHAVDPTLVSGGVVIAADYFKMFVASLRKIVGGRFNAFETLVDRGRREAILRMKEQARAAGASMIFNVRVETTRIQNGARGGPATVETFAYGTALCPAAGAVEASPHQFRFGPPLAEAEAMSIRNHRAATAAMAVWFVAVLLTVSDGFVFDRYRYVDGAPWGLFLVLALAGGSAVAAVLHRFKTPLSYVVSVSLLMTLTLPFLFFVGGLRVNALSDVRPELETPYRLQEDRSLVALEPGYPNLSFPADHDYWEAQDIGSEHRFLLRRGVFGFWQLNSRQYADQVNPFYIARFRQRKAAQR